jgi:preprotein translocase subunit SecA
MIFTLKSEVIERIYKVQIQAVEEDDMPHESPVEKLPPLKEQKMTLSRGDGAQGEEPEKSKPQTRAGSKIGRNDPCPCGSGKKYKKCCGA